MVPRKSQANQQIGQIIGGQKQRSRMKDNLYRVENYTVEEKNINNMAVTNGSQQSNQPYYQGMKKPPIYWNMQLAAYNLDRKDVFSKSDPFFILSG